MTTNTSFFGALGIDASAAGTPFWKPASKKQTVRVLAARKPSAQEVVKKLPDGRGEVVVLAILDVEVQGNPHVCEVSSKRFLHALDVELTGKALPVDLDVWTEGKNTDTRFFVRPHVKADRLAPGKLAAPCDAPGCVYERGHAGQHKTAKAVEADAAAE